MHTHTCFNSLLFYVPLAEGDKLSRRTASEDRQVTRGDVTISPWEPRR